MAVTIIIELKNDKIINIRCNNFFFILRCLKVY